MDLNDLIQGLESEINKIEEQDSLSEVLQKPEQKPQQQQITQPQKPQQIVIQQQQQQAPKPAQQQQQYQQQFQQQQQQQQQQKQQQQQQQSNTTNNNQSLIEKEQFYTKPQSFKSLVLLQAELNIIKNNCLQSQAIQNNPQAQIFYQNLLKSLEQQKKQLIGFVEDGKLKPEIYCKFILEAMKEQKAQYEQAQSQGDQFFIQRIAKRMNLLQTEMAMMKQNPQQGFSDIIKKISPNTEIPISNNDKRAIQKGINKQESIQIAQQNKYSNFNTEKAIEANIDQQKAHVKFETLLKRYKIYYNLANYFLTYAKERRKEDIQEILALLEKGKGLRTEFTQGQNPNIGSYLINELKELTLERFHKMNQQQYKNQQTKIFNQLLDANNKEKEFYKIAHHSKRIQIGKNQTYNPHEESKSRLMQYGGAFEHLKLLQQMQWILLPEIESQDLDVPICIENKNIPQGILRLKFKKLNNIKYEKYFLTFSLDNNKQVISKQTEICDLTCSFNADFDILLESSVDYTQKYIEVRLFEKGFFGSSEIGIGKLQLDSIKVTTSFDGIVNIQSKKQNIELSYSLQIREPLDKYTIAKVQFVKLVVKCPQFNPEEGLKEYLDQEMVKLPTYEEYKQQQEKKRLEEERQRMEEEQRKQMEENQMEQEKVSEVKQQNQVFLNHMDNENEIQTIKSFLSTNPQLPPELTPNDILYPENPMKFPIFNFIMEYEPEANKKSIELKQEPSKRQWARFVQNMWEDYTRQKTIIQRKLDNEDFDWYVEKIQNLLPLENFLIETYKKLNLQQWVQFVTYRKSILEKELAELEGMQ